MQQQKKCKKKINKSKKNEKNAGGQTTRQTRSPQSTTTSPATTQARAGALVPPPPCLGGGATRVGLSQYPQHPRADHGQEAVGSSSQQHSTALFEPKLQHGSGATVEHRQFRIPSGLFQGCVKEGMLCLSLFSSRSGNSKTNIKDLGRRSAVQVVQRVPDPVTDRVMDSPIMRRWCPFPFWRCRRSRDRAESARTVQGYRHARCDATPGVDDSEGAGHRRSSPGANHRTGGGRVCVQRQAPTGRTSE